MTPPATRAERLSNRSGSGWAVQNAGIVNQAQPIQKLATALAALLLDLCARARAGIASTVRGSTGLVVWEDLATNPASVGQFITYLDAPPLGTTQRFLCLRITTPIAGLP